MRLWWLERRLAEVTGSTLAEMWTASREDGHISARIPAKSNRLWNAKSVVIRRAFRKRRLKIEHIWETSPRLCPSLSSEIGEAKCIPSRDVFLKDYSFPLKPLEEAQISVRTAGWMFQPSYQPRIGENIFPSVWKESWPLCCEGRQIVFQGPELLAWCIGEWRAS
jgi:hypothetical protein